MSSDCQHLRRWRARHGSNVRKLRCTDLARPLYPQKADMCVATRDVRFGPEADMCSARPVRQGPKAEVISRITLPDFDHRGGRRGLRLDPDIIGEAKPTAARSAAGSQAPKRGMCRSPAIRLL